MADSPNRISHQPRELEAVLEGVKGVIRDRLARIGVGASEFEALGLDIRTPPVDSRATFNYWVRWQRGEARLGFLTVGHAWSPSEYSGRLVSVKVALPDGDVVQVNARLRFSSSARVDAALLEVEADQLGQFPALRAAFDHAALSPVTAAELNASAEFVRSGLAVRHHLGGGPSAEVRVEVYTSTLPAAFFFRNQTISCTPYRQAVPPSPADLRGVVFASAAETRFEEGRSGTAWTLNGRPLAVQLAGNSANAFKEGFGQLVSFILEEFAATSDQKDIEIVRVG